MGNRSIVVERGCMVNAKEIKVAVEENRTNKKMLQRSKLKDKREK